MSLLSHILPHETKYASIRDLLDKSAHDGDFYILLVGATMLVIGGIFIDSVPVLIASMIIAPLGYPILSLGLGIIARSSRLITRSTVLLVAACSTALLLAGLSTFIVPESAPEKYVVFTGHRYTALIVAVVSGFIAAYGMIKPKVATATTGVAIAVSLLPPLVASGINYANGNMDIGNDAMIMFLLNVAGVLGASTLIFWLFGMGKAYRTIDNR